MWAQVAKWVAIWWNRRHGKRHVTLSPILILSAIPALVIAILVWAFLSMANTVATSIAAASSTSGTACPTAAPSDATPGLDAVQTQTATEVLRAARDLNVPSRGWVVAIATGLQESGLRPIDYGDNAADGSSRGVFQQLAAWGPLEDRLDPYRSARMFFSGGQAGQRGLLAVPGWEQMSLADAAQAVQHSAFPSAYAKHEAQATAIVTALSGQIPNSTCAGGGGPVYIAGDSITVGSEPDIRAALGSRQVTIQAEVGRRIDQGLAQLRFDAQQLDGATLVVALCTNWGGDQAAFSRAMDDVLSVAQRATTVVFVTCTELGPAQAAANAAIRTHPGITVAEWAGPSRAPGVLGPDGVHPTIEGRKVFAQVIATAVPSGGEVVGGYALPLPRDQIHSPLPRHHDGGPSVDIPAPEGTPIYAVVGGAVHYTSEGNDCGLGLTITDPANTIWTYCHSSVRFVADGATVATGQNVALVGSTGESTGPHLHLQISTGGTSRCPQPFLDALVAGQPVAPASISTPPPCA